MIDQDAIKNQKKATGTTWRILLCYLFTIASIVSSDTLLAKLSKNPIYETIGQYLYVFVVCTIVLFYYFKNKMKIEFSLDTGLFVLTILMLFLDILFLKDSITPYLFKVLLIVGGFYGVRVFRFEDFYKAFRHIMLILMLASLLLYFMKVTGIGYSLLPVRVTENGVPYSTIGLANITNSEFYKIPRAESIFWEPGVYAAYLCVLLMFELFHRKTTDIKYLLLALVSLATTVSTTGYIVIMIILIAYILSKPTKKIRIKVIITILMAILLVIIAANETIFSQLTSKITENRESFKNRWLCIEGNFIVIRKAPIFGLGPYGSQAVVESYIRSMGGVKSLNNLNTILANYSVFGLLPFIYYIYHLLKFSFSFKIHQFGKILIIIALTFLLSSTGFQFSPFFTLVFMFRLDGESKCRIIP